MYFGNYAIVDDAVYNFEKEPDWYWKFKPISSGLELERSKFMLHNRVVMDVNGNRREFPPTWLEVCHREIALTFGGTNIPKAKDNDEPALSEKASIQEIEAFLRLMPQEMVMELWNKIGELYPEWGPVLPPKAETSES